MNKLSRYISIIVFLILHQYCVFSQSFDACYYSMASDTKISDVDYVVRNFSNFVWHVNNGQLDSYNRLTSFNLITTVEMSFIFTHLHTWQVFENLNKAFLSNLLSGRFLFDIIAQTEAMSFFRATPALYKILIIFVLVASILIIIGYIYIRRLHLNNKRLSTCKEITFTI